MTARRLAWIEDIIESIDDVKLRNLRKACFDELRDLVELAQSGLDQSQTVAGTLKSEDLESILHRLERAEHGDGVWSRSSDNEDSDPAEVATQELSPYMKSAVSALETHGVLYRWWGGYWSAEKPVDPKDRPPRGSVSHICGVYTLVLEVAPALQ